MRLHSTREAAARLGVSLVTVQRQIAAGKLDPPRLQTIGGIKMRLWSDSDIERVKKQLQKGKAPKKA